VVAPAWWNPWTYPAFPAQPETTIPLELLNWFIPFMAPSEQAAIGRFLYQTAASAPESFPQITPAYNAPAAPAASTAQWLSSISGVTGAPMPGRNTQEEAWLKGLFSAAQNLGPGMGRLEQRKWRADLTSLLETAPNQLARSLGEHLFNPTLTAPEPGQAAPLGNYILPFRTKGGLVSNPWYI